MTGRAAREFHDATKHTWQSVRTPRPIDWSARPLPYKLYRDLAPRPLPLTVHESGWPAVDALSGVGPDQPTTVTVEVLASLLLFSAGVTRRWRRGGAPVQFRAAASAGALYPIEVYVVCADLPGSDGGLPAGVYHFGPYEFALRCLRAGDHRRVLAQAAVAEDIAHAPVALVLTGIPWRTTWKYGARGYRHLWWDAGTIAAHLTALATALGLPIRLHAGFIDRDVDRLVGVDSHTEASLLVVRLGDGAPTAPPVADPPPLQLEVVEPPSGPEADVGRIHTLGGAEHAAAVTAWRSAVVGAATVRATELRRSPPLAAFEPVEDVILRRGATRRFRHEPVDEEVLVWPSAVASRPLPADWLPAGRRLCGLHTVVHAVRGVEPGIYRWTPYGPELHRPGRFRGECTTVCLEQRLGGDGAYTAFHTVELDAVLDAGGARAYRAAMLEAGIASGLLQLAATTVGAGSTPLTFYDDDARRLLDTVAEVALVTAVGIPAYRPRPGARPSEDPPGRLRP